MVEMEASPLVLRNLLTSIFIYVDKSLSYVVQKHRVFQFLRSILLSAFLFFLRVLPCIFTCLNLNSQQNLKSDDITNFPNTIKGGESGIGRALSQLLWIINDLPVSSRKYETVRSLAEMLIDENLLEGCETLREINCSVLSTAFSRTLTLLEARVAVMDHDGVGELNYETQPQPQPQRQPQPAVYYRRLNRVLRTVWYYGGVAWTGFGRSRDEFKRTGSSAEKMTAELLWMAQKLAASGGGEEAVFRWASATKLAAMALSAEPRLQGSLLKVSAFLLKQAKEMGGEEKEESKREQERQTKMKLLISWLPLLCRASGGQDAPVLSTSEKAELERVLENIIESLEQEEEQEKVLSLWLHHFTHCLSSDWPNLHSCYTRWCNASRTLFLRQLQYKYIEKKLP